MCKGSGWSPGTSAPATYEPNLQNLFLFVDLFAPITCKKYALQSKRNHESVTQIYQLHTRTHAFHSFISICAITVTTRSTESAFRFLWHENTVTLSVNIYQQIFAGTPPRRSQKLILIIQSAEEVFLLPRLQISSRPSSPVEVLLSWLQVYTLHVWQLASKAV